jgi:hypothetical protein
MKLNYRDKIILGVLLAFVILLGGFFLLIKPKYTSIQDNKEKLVKVEKERDEVDAKIAEIPGLQDEIKSTYEATKKLTNDFVAYNDIYNARKVDQYMQHFAEDSEVKITTLTASDISEATLDYYFFTPTFIGADQLKGADLNGDRQAANTKLSEESDSLKARTKERVLNASYIINVTGTKEGVYNYLKAIEEQDKTIIINSVTINGVFINPEAIEKQAKALSLEISEDQRKQLEDDAEATAQLNISLYSVFDLSEPNVEAD